MTTETMFLDAAVATHGAAARALSGHGIHGMHGAAGCHHHPTLWFALAALVIGFFILRAIVRGVMRRRYGYGFGYGHCGRGGWDGPGGSGGRWPRGGRCDEGGGPHGFHGHPGGEGHGGRSRGNPLHVLFYRLDTSASQEKVIREAADAFRTEAGGVRDAIRAAREPFGELVEAETFDHEAADALFAAPEAKLHEARASVTRSFAAIHAVLTPNQRKELAAAIRRGPRLGFFRRPSF